VTAPVLEVEDLVVAFDTDEGQLRAVDGIAFTLEKGRVLGVVGESGSGKSVTALAILGLLPEPQGRVLRGRVLLDGKDIVHESEALLQKVRGRRIAMIFQEPMTALDPLMRVGDQIAEGLRHHLRLSAGDARARAIALLGKVGIPAPAERIDSYPHELSGGMRQRVMIASAIACEPSVLLADEPTTALDVTIQAQILALLDDLRRELGMSVVLITHDLGVVADIADDVVVMYAGRVVERANKDALFARPLHPYTRGLLESVPGFGENASKRRLPTIRGLVPDLRHLPKGCRFRDRCDRAIDRCAEVDPPLEAVADHLVACIRAKEEAPS
jgi:oligopeptide/dipeptide ABC transporter ATP-binding protein